jgi:pilus assembly protein CpaE
MIPMATTEVGDGLASVARKWTVIDGGGGRPVIAALIRTPQFEAAAQALSGAGMLLRPQPVAELDRAILASLEADVIVCEADIRNRGEIEVLHQFVAETPGVPVVLASPGLDVQAICELLSLGIKGIVPQPMREGDLLKAVQRALAEPAAETPVSRRGKVIGWLGSRGGVGSTSLLVQGACALAHLRRFKRPHDLCVLDLDLQFGNAALLLDAEPRGSLLDLVESPERLDGALVRGAMAPAGHTKFSLLACPRDFRPIDDIDPQAVCAAIEAVRREYEVTIMDMPILWSAWTHAALQVCDAFCLVVEPTVPALRQGRRQLDTLREEDLGDIPLKVVANKVPTGFFGAVAPPMKAIREALGRDADFVVPEAEAIRAAAEAGKPLCDVHGGARLETKLADMMEAIIGERIKDFHKREGQEAEASQPPAMRSTSGGRR